MKYPAPSASIARAAAIAALVSGLALAGPLQAASADTSGDYPQNTMDQTQPQPPPPKDHRHGEMTRHSPQDMERRVEDRIKTLHKKLGITDAEEAKWSDVAQVMRDNEAAMERMLQERHQNVKSMTAVDDLQSYENIAQAHADGLKKLIPAFQALYNDMSDAQKKTADETFGSFEGHGHMSAGKHE